MQVMRPLPLMGLGLALVILDFRTEALDLLPDALGWGLVALGAWRLDLTAPACLAVATAVASTADAWIPFRYVWVAPTGEEGPVPPEDAAGAYVDPNDVAAQAVGARTGDKGSVHLRYDDVSGWHLAAMTVAMVLAACTMWLLLSRLAARAEAAGRDRPARRLRLARWLMLAAWTAPFAGAVVHALAYESGGYDAVWNGSLELTWLAALAVYGLVIVVAVQEGDRAWAIPAGVSGASGASPWQRLADARGTGRGDGPGGRAGRRNGRDADGTGKDE